MSPAPSRAIVPARDPEPNFRGRPATRTRAADHVFESLSRAILCGELVPGSVLATQRELSKQFAVSSLIVRQATHRLEEIGLLRVRQGSTTIVLDPEEAADVRLLQLQLEVATPGDWLALAARENYALSSLPLLALAERRISDAELRLIDELIETLPESPNDIELLQFQLSFWRLIAKCTQNPVMQQNVRWWARLMSELEAHGHNRRAPIPDPRARYRGLLRALRRRRGTVEYWLRALQPLLDWTEAQPKHSRNRVAIKQSSAADPRGIVARDY
jgi:DNA-binding FadR family transcriptional regulator